MASNPDEHPFEMRLHDQPAPPLSLWQPQFETDPASDAEAGLAEWVEEMDCTLNVGVGGADDAFQESVREMGSGPDSSARDPDDPEEVAMETNSAGSPEEIETWAAPTGSTFGSALPTFPIEYLPAGWLRDYVTAVAAELQTPVDLPANLALSVLAAASAKTVEVVVGEHREPVNIYSIVALPPSSRKSAVLKRIAAPIRDYEQALVQTAATAAKHAGIKSELLKKVKNRALGMAAKRGDGWADQFQVAAKADEHLLALATPAQSRLLVDDVTPASLVSVMAGNHGRIAVLADEGALLAQLTRRADGSGGGVEVFLKSHNGGDLRVDRKSRAPEIISSPALTLGLLTQPESLRGLGNQKALGSGLLARFIYALPRSMVGERLNRPPQVTDSLRSQYREAVLNLLRIRVPDFPHRLELDEPALELCSTFSLEIETRLADDGDLRSMRDWAGKLVGLVMRLAGLLHMAEHAPGSLPGPDSQTPRPWDEKINAKTMQAAIAIGRYLIPHSQAAYALMLDDVGPESVQIVRNWIKSRPDKPFTARDVFEGTKGHFKQMDKLQPVLDSLAEDGVLERQERIGPPKKGRPSSPVYVARQLALYVSILAAAFHFRRSVA